MLEGLIARTRNPQRLAELKVELESPPFPEPLAYLWQAFCRLHARRGAGGFGIAPISWPDIDAFTRHSQMSLAPWEVRMIEQLDDLYRIEHSKVRD